MSARAFTFKSNMSSSFSSRHFDKKLCGCTTLCYPQTKRLRRTRIRVIGSECARDLDPVLALGGLALQLVPHQPLESPLRLGPRRHLRDARVRHRPGL